MNYKKLFTSESVTEGHPDKISDLISDAILDAILADDPQARVACEVTVTTGLVMVVGEISTKSYVDIKKIGTMPRTGTCWRTSTTSSRSPRPWASWPTAGPAIGISWNGLVRCPRTRM